MKQKLNWKDIDFACVSLAYEIAKGRYGKIKALYGIPRGGMVPAVILSHKTGLPLIPDLMQAEQFEKDQILIVDDIYDSGKTAYNYGMCLGFKNMAFLVTKNEKAQKAPISFSKDIWVEFPWEIEGE